jgi:hypothetical protein
MECDEPLRQPIHGGRPRRFCGDSCRKKHEARRRRSDVMEALTGPPSWPVILPEVELPLEALNLPSDPDEAVVAVVRDTKADVGRLAVCGSRARGRLAWRCAKASEEIGSVLARYFPTRAALQDTSEPGGQP